MSEQRVFLCEFRELQDGTSRGFSIDTPVGPQDIFVVRRNEQLFAYRNSCPHTGGPIDWVPDQFLSLDGSMIQCATHDARFRIEDGVCVAGPCVGRRLSPVTVLLADGVVHAVFSIQPRARDS